MIVFCATDAGPAEYLAQIITHISMPKIIFSSKISSAIFDKHGIESSPLDLKKLSSKVELIICGSSFGLHSTENDLFEWANNNNRKSVLVIEHWTNLSQRLNRIKKVGVPISNDLNNELAVVCVLPLKTFICFMVLILSTIVFVLTTKDVLG